MKNLKKIYSCVLKEAYMPKCFWTNRQAEGYSNSLWWGSRFNPALHTLPLTASILPDIHGITFILRKMREHPGNPLPGRQARGSPPAIATPCLKGLHRRLYLVISSAGNSQMQSVQHLVHFISFHFGFNSMSQKPVTSLR